MSLKTSRGPRWTVIAVAVAVTAALSGCVASRFDEQIAGYTCCNLRSQTGWISSNNVQGGDLIPYGEPIKLESIKKQYYVYGSIGGADYGFRDDAAKSQEDTMRWVRRLVVPTDPRLQVASWPAEFRAAAGAGRVVRGMTKEQVTIALGHPSRNDTPDLGAATWRYWTPAEDAPVDLTFGADGRLVEIAGRPSAVKTVEL